MAGGIIRELNSRFMVAQIGIDETGKRASKNAQINDEIKLTYQKFGNMIENFNNDVRDFQNYYA